MVTPKQLIAELGRRGYPVTDRKIRDWRDKGLLPPLERHGNGQGRGTRFCWNNEEVINQAIAAYELLSRRARTTDAILGLWFIGYPMEPKAIKPLWLARLKRTQNALLHGGFDREAADDKLSSLSAKLTHSLATQSGIVHRHLESLVTEFVSALLNPSYSISDDDIWELGSAASALLTTFVEDDARFVISNPLLARALTFTRQNLSLDSALNLIASATNAELEIAHQRWRSVICLIALLSTPVHSEETAEMGRQFAAIVGGLCTLALLHLGRNRKGHLVDFWINKFEQEIRSGKFDSSRQICRD